MFAWHYNFLMLVMLIKLFHLFLNLHRMLSNNFDFGILSMNFSSKAITSQLNTIFFIFFLNSLLKINLFLKFVQV